MVDFTKIQLFLQGHQIDEGYALLDLFRENFDFGKDINITIVTNSQDNNYKDGIVNSTEDCFIRLGSNRGYWDGCLDNWNAALQKARLNNLPYTIIMNFDFWFTKQEGFLNVVSDFIESEKSIGTHYSTSPYDGNFFYLPTDFMMFKTDLIHKMQRLNDEILPFRENNKELLTKEKAADQRCFEERMLKVLFDALNIDYSNIGLETEDEFYYGTRLIEDYSFIFDYILPPYNDYDNLNINKYFCLHTHDKNFKNRKMIEEGYTKGKNLRNFFNIQ